MGRPIGSYSALEVKEMDCTVMVTEKDAKWKPSRPIPYFSIPSRLKMAWDVLVCKADALYW